MIEIIFLIAISLAWISFAVANDLKERIVPDWLNFSLVIFLLGFRFFYSLFLGNFDFFYQGLLGFAVFLALGNIFYYGRMFAGGDAKLMIALGAAIPLSANFSENLNLFMTFLISFLFSGAIYGFGCSFFLFARNFEANRKEFARQMLLNGKFIVLSSIFGDVFFVLGFFNQLWFYLGIFFIVTPYLYIYAKSVDESSLVKKIKTKNLTPGDWLYKDVKVKGGVIKSNWDGLSKNEVAFLKKNMREIKIREGIPFTPVFLMAFLAMIWFYFSGMNIFEIF